MKILTAHKFANIFPMMDQDSFIALRQDIEKNGLVEPIETYQGQIIDGRNRFRACLELNIEPVFKEWQGGDLLTYIISKNLHRRHLDESQRALIGARIANIGHGGDRKSDQDANLHLDISQNTASKELNISRRSIANAQVVLAKGHTELVKAVEQGSISVSTASNASELPKAIQKDFVKKVSAGEKPSRALLEVKRKERNKTLKNRDLAELDGIFDVIYADPPYKFENSTTPDREAENHYPTMEHEDLKNMKVPEICADNAILFLWCPNAKMGEALEIMAAWGFTLKTNFVWVKGAIGLGHWNRQRHELLLVGVKGEMATPDPENRFDSVIEAKRGKHSQKPDTVYYMIQAMYPHAKKIELFARKAMSGWSNWGNEDISGDKDV